MSIPTALKFLLPVECGYQDRSISIIGYQDRRGVKPIIPKNTRSSRRSGGGLDIKGEMPFAKSYLDEIEEVATQ